MSVLEVRIPTAIDAGDNIDDQSHLSTITHTRTSLVSSSNHKPPSPTLLLLLPPSSIYTTVNVALTLKSPELAPPKTVKLPGSTT
jgi:hypothetical protein